MDKFIVFISTFIAVFVWCAGPLQASEQLLGRSQLANGEPVVSRTSPFLTLQEELSLEKQGSTIPILYLEVTAIFYSPQAEKSRAIIEGRVLSIGDTIDNKQIVTINPEDVILKDSQAYYVVRMKKISLAVNS